MRQLNPFTRLASVVAPDAELMAEGRRVFLSPLTQASLLFCLLKGDPAFLRALPSYDDEHLIIFAFCDHRLCANIYTLTTDVRATPAFNPEWANEGYFHYRMDANGVCTHLIRPISGRFYDRFDPVLSYSRPLSVEEESLIETMRLH
jgi:hypothetical protein